MSNNDDPSVLLLFALKLLLAALSLSGADRWHAPLIEQESEKERASLWPPVVVYLTFEIRRSRFACHMSITSHRQTDRQSVSQTATEATVISVEKNGKEN